MNRALVDPVADAVMYEGYILYPYRPSTKNRQRWTFGGLYPEPSCRARGGGDAWSQQTECLVRGTRGTTFEAVVRFLHLTDRQVGAVDPGPPEPPEGGEPPSRPVESLQVGDKSFHAWQEAEPREVAFGPATLADLADRPSPLPFRFEGGRRVERLRGPGGDLVGVLTRRQWPVEGVVEVSADEVDANLFRLTVRTSNRTPWPDAGRFDRDEALLRTLVSTHALLGVDRGEFVSLMDPPDACREAAAACRNVGAWPVLAGEEGRNDTMLASPIILYDYPQVAPESPGDFFDGTEIDEMLTLRIMTLTDEEKGAMAAVDERAGALLARTEARARDQLRDLHGALRGLRDVPAGGRP